HVLVAAPVAAAGDVGVGDLVDDGDLRLALEDRLQVHLLDGDAAVLEGLAGDGGQTGDERRRLGAAMRLHEAEHHVDAAPLERVRLLQHAVGLPDPGREPDVELEPAALGAPEHLEEVLGTRLARSRHGLYVPSYFLRLRQSVEASMPSNAAASSTLGTRSSTERMCSRSISSTLKSPPTVGRRWAARGTRVGNASGSTTDVGQRMAIRSIVLRSSRTFPGQSCCSSASAAGGEISGAIGRVARVKVFRKARANGRMSSRRSRKGGIRTSTTLRR